MPVKFQNSCIQVSPLENQLVLVSLDMPNKSANVLTEQMFSDINEAWDHIDQSADSIRGVIIQSAKEKIFVAGADLVRIANTLDWSDQRITQFCEDGRKTFARFKSNPFPVVAAIHGACVGGGFELTLWCDFRIASNNRRTIFGLPEVKLGLVPGWAGTCILPRLIGVQEAAKLTSLATLFDSTKAKELSAIDHVVESDELLSSAVQFLEKEIESQAFIQARQQMLNAPSASEEGESFKSELTKEIHGAEEVDNNAAEIVLEHMLNSAGADFEKACASESVAMTRVYGSDNCAGLLNSFFLNERARKSGSQIVAEASPRDVKTIGIIGCGQMGAGLTELALKAGYSVVAFDRESSVISALPTKLNHLESINNLSAVDQLSELAPCDLLIESIVEETNAKRELFESLNEIVADDAIIATNTSVIPLSELSSSVKNPQRFLGIHFCSPVAISRLVEVIRCSETDNNMTAAAIELTRKIRKTPIVMNDGPGFIVNRLLAPYFEEAHRLLLKGNGVQEIDMAMRDYGFPLGPFEMMDLIGNDVVYQAGRLRYRRDPLNVFLSPVIPALVKQEYLGHKNRLGYYEYSEFDLESLRHQMAPPNSQAFAMINEYVRETEHSDSGEIQRRLTFAMVLEACEVLDEGIVDDPRDIDLCLQFGLGYPANKGGLLFWSDWKKIDSIVEQLRRWSESENDSRFQPHARLVEMEKSESGFYSSLS